MTRPLPIELRERVVKAYTSGEGTYREIAARFMIGEATVSRLLARYRRTGALDPDPMGGARHIHKVHEDALKYVKMLLDDDATWTRDELREELHDAFGIEVSVATVGRAIKRLGYSRKRGLYASPRPVVTTS